MCLSPMLDVTKFYRFQRVDTQRSESNGRSVRAAAMRVDRFCSAAILSLLRCTQISGGWLYSRVPYNSTGWNKRTGRIYHQKLIIVLGGIIVLGYFLHKMNNVCASTRSDKIENKAIFELGRKNILSFNNRTGSNKSVLGQFFFENK